MITTPPPPPPSPPPGSSWSSWWAGMGSGIGSWTTGRSSRERSRSCRLISSMMKASSIRFRPFEYSAPRPQPPCNGRRDLVQSGTLQLRPVFSLPPPDPLGNGRPPTSTSLRPRLERFQRARELHARELVRDAIDERLRDERGLRDLDLDPDLLPHDPASLHGRDELRVPLVRCDDVEHLRRRRRDHDLLGDARGHVLLRSAAGDEPPPYSTPPRIRFPAPLRPRGAPGARLAAAGRGPPGPGRRGRYVR